MKSGTTTKITATVLGVLRRVATNVALDARYLRHPHEPWTARMLFVGRKYFAILTGQRTVTWFGKRFAYDNVWTPALLQGYPYDVSEVLERATEIGPAPTVLDVGANCGQFAATFLGLRPDARIWSMEPNGAVLQTLRRNAEAAEGWHVLPFGCGPVAEDKAFWFVPGKSGQGSVHEENASLGLLGGEATRTTVEIRPLDAPTRAEVSAPDAFDIVKIDVEGAEREALAGLAEISWRYLVIEASTGRAGATGRDELLEILRAAWGADVRVAAVLTASSTTEELLFERTFDHDRLDG